MTRRAVTVAASGLAVLAVLIGVGSAAGQDATGPGAAWRAPANQSTPTTGASRSEEPPPSPRPADSLLSPPVPPSPTRSPSARPSTPPLDLKRTTGQKAVALTFDDGPHPVWTPKILDELRKAGVHATFCVVGVQAQRYPQLVARIVREGHSLCNHSWRHEFDLGKRPEAEIRANLERTNRAILRAVPGAKIRFFRHPGGNWTPAAVKVAKDLGMVSLHWSVDPRDWENPGARTIEKRVMGKVKPGSIVLLHDGGGDRSDTLTACRTILPSLKRTYGTVLLT